VGYHIMGALCCGGANLLYSLAKRQATENERAAGNHTGRKPENFHSAYIHRKRGHTEHT
jgi:hypothetical protein